MFKTVAKLFLSKQIIFEKGHIVLLGHRDSFTPLNTYVEILRIMLKNKNENLIYKSCKTSGYEWFELMAKNFPGMKQMEAIKWGIDLVTLSGWGIPSLKKADLNKKHFIFILKNSTTAKNFGKYKEPVDHLFRGLVAGGMSYIVKTDLDSIETHCTVLGDKVCEFFVAPQKDLLALAKDFKNN